MKSLYTITAICLLAGSLSAQVIIIPNGDFEDGATNWVHVAGNGDTTPVTFATGGNPGGYGTVTPVGGWGILVSPTLAGNVGGGVPIGDLGLTAGEPVTFVYDSINLTGPGPAGGFKWEAWGNNALVGNTGDTFPSVIGTGTTWETYTYDWVLPAGTDKLIFVPLWAGGDNPSTIGFDNVGVIPEPSTYAALFGLFALGFVAWRRRRC
ncbi:MAG: PEP-CTERM sorting domain-containing protein [Opitutales bacterium]|nr:PEP-CTERM sorting domain-containing protein [Opitutales bacterium]